MKAIRCQILLSGCATSTSEMIGNLHSEVSPQSFYQANAKASRAATVATNGVVAASILVHKHRAAVTETGPKQTVEKFGEVYAVSPNCSAVHRDEPTQIRFWNLLRTDNHGFILMRTRPQVLTNLPLPPPKKIVHVFSFHQDGLHRFVCSLHPNLMFGALQRQCLTRRLDNEAEAVFGKQEWLC